MKASLIALMLPALTIDDTKHLGSTSKAVMTKLGCSSVPLTSSHTCHDEISYDSHIVSMGGRSPAVTAMTVLLLTYSPRGATAYSRW